MGTAALGAAFLTGNLLQHRPLATLPVEAAATPTAGHPLFLNLLDFNADPSGKTDSSAAFLRALNELERSAVHNPSATLLDDPTLRGRAGLFIPPGSYVITKPEVLMRKSYKLRTLGLVIQGAGRGVTQLVYRNRTPGQYLLHNHDAWLFITIADIEFISEQAVNNFMYSYSEGGAQNYTFERCVWNGKWNDVFHFEGTNNNSELTWFHCNFSGEMKRAVYVPSKNGSDQFLNYNFYACQFEVTEGDYLVFEKGGNINVWGGSLIHRDERKGGTFFKLLNGSHALGVQRFLCIGTRFELRNSRSRLIECQWNDGTVSFISCDMSSQSFRVEPAVQAVFCSNNQKMPVVQFQGCLLAGKHEYRYQNDSWNAPHNIVYENCEFAQSDHAASFIVYTNEETAGESKAGGQPLIRFRNCRSIAANATSAFFDSDLGYRQNNRAQLAKKLVSVRTAEGGFPVRGGQESFSLPQGAIILQIRLLGKAGAAPDGQAYSYWIETSESTPLRIITSEGASEGQGFDLQQDIFFECDTAERRQLRLCAGSGNGQLNRTALCLIEYIG